MGTVYLAEDPRLKRRVAVKMLPESEAIGEAVLSRFTREARILAALNHPNIATVYSLEESDGLQFITMEYVLGDTLGECIGSRALGPARSYRICRQIAAALGAAHGEGVIHRDLKPSNIMVTKHEQVKVLDFGLAKMTVNRAGPSDSTWTLSPGTSSSAVLGTIGYMSPEQLRGREVDARADVWAFGCCLYECLSGKMAFHGSSAAERAAATLEREPDLKALGDLPKPIVELLQRSLEKDPGKRLAGIEEVTRLLDQITPAP